MDMKAVVFRSGRGAGRLRTGTEEVRRSDVAGRGGRRLPDTQERLMGMSTGEWASYLAGEPLDVPPPEDVIAEGSGSAIGCRPESIR